MPNATNHKPVLNKEKACDKINALFRLDKTTLILLFVGRITFQKNLQLILDALKILSDNKVNFKMLFVGSGQDECRLISKIQSLNLEDKVILCGKITDTTLLQNVYARAKLLLFPSLYDASSLVQIEASCQKTPTVFVDGARTACGIKKDENGFIAKPTARDYANEIMRILADEELYKKVSENCFKDLYLTWEEVVKNVYLEYLRLTNLKNKAT